MGRRINEEAMRGGRDKMGEDRRKESDKRGGGGERQGTAGEEIARVSKGAVRHRIPLWCATRYDCLL